MVIVLIRTQLRSDADLAAYEALGGEMFALVQTLPGFLGADSYGSGDAEISVIRFASLASLETWRNHPQHVAAQRRGRDELYASYTIEICEVVRAYDRETSALGLAR